MRSAGAHSDDTAASGSVQRRRTPARPRDLKTLEAGHPDDRHRPAGLRAVGRRRRPRERRGLRGRGRLRRRRAARLRQGRGGLDALPFNEAIAARPARPFDFDINQFSITEERKQGRRLLLAVLHGQPGGHHDGRARRPTARRASPTSRALKLGAQVGTTSLRGAQRASSSRTPAPVVFNSNDDAKLALQNGQVDAIVVDLPTAFYITAAELDDGVIVGQLRGLREGGDQFGLVLDKDSPLTDCVSQAVDALREDGTLAELEQQWLVRRRRRARPRPDAVTPTEPADLPAPSALELVPPGVAAPPRPALDAGRARCRTAAVRACVAVRRRHQRAGLAAGAGDRSSTRRRAGSRCPQILRRAAG